MGELALWYSGDLGGLGRLAGAIGWSNEQAVPGGEEDETDPVFSPDGRHIGFLIQGTTLRTVSLDGGPTPSLTDSANTTGGDWGRDGYVYFEVDSGVVGAVACSRGSGPAGCRAPSTTNPPPRHPRTRRA